LECDKRDGDSYA